ncbi:cation transporter [Candidatus Woesearchaeota archaeon]|nr:MAG: cation transporter [Candidatus Woesearchaeota archaeon]
MKTTIYVPDIECESCSKLISRKLKHKEGINQISIKPDSVDIDYDESKIKPEQLVQTIKDAEFRAGLEPFERKTFKERWRDFKENKKKYHLELKGIEYAAFIFLILTALEAIAYFGFLKTPTFLTNYGWWFFYLNISITAISFGLWHIFAYKTKITCMVGMMIGMTLGMQTGMMIGAILGATNGFFIGAMTGMILGVTVGIIAGKCCGIMGIMEGMMAGLMGGTMGPMISLMMFSDHLLWFMPAYMIINLLIIAGLSYMMYEEVVEYKEVRKQPLDFLTIASLCIIVAFVLIMIILYGPKAAFLR